MINELSEQPFNKLECLSLLNTLFPPVHAQTKLPSSYLSVETMRDERQIFFDSIGQVQRNGISVLRPLMEIKDPEGLTGWPAVQKVVDKYLRVALNMIEDCVATVGPETFDRCTTVYGKESKHDSGVSFGSERRPSVGLSVREAQMSEPPVANYAPPSKGLSKLERITREFRRMRVKPRPEVEEIVHVTQRVAAEPVSSEPIPSSNRNVSKKSLKKARSLASLRFGNGSSLSLASRKGSDAVPFDPEQMKKHRLVYEASVRNNTGST